MLVALYSTVSVPVCVVWWTSSTPEQYTQGWFVYKGCSVQAVVPLGCTCLLCTSAGILTCRCPSQQILILCSQSFGHCVGFHWNIISFNFCQDCGCVLWHYCCTVLTCLVCGHWEEPVWLWISWMSRTLSFHLWLVVFVRKICYYESRVSLWFVCVFSSKPSKDSSLTRFYWHIFSHNSCIIIPCKVEKERWQFLSPNKHDKGRVCFLCQTNKRFIISPWNYQ